MRYCLTIAGALSAVTLVALQPAHAFTFENPGAGAASPTKGDPKSGYVDLDPASALPPIGETLPGMRFNEGPGAYNNGLASPPDPRNSVGPSWLYGR